MTEINRELAQWRKSKTPLLTKYQEEHTKAMSTIAGRGFLDLPGYGFEMETGLETFTKLALSELNYKILTETVERELKQSGLDYDNNYKNAVMLWNVEKQAFLNDWAAEFAGIKQQEAQDEETLTRLAIDVGRRSIILLEAKTALELQKEAYQLQLVGLDAEIYPYEVQLANQQLLTAQTKLNIIPILEEIITKEQELLLIEQSKAAQYSLLMTQELELAAKKQLLLPYLSELVNVTEAYVLKLETQMALEGQIASEKLLQAQSYARKAALKLIELETEIGTAYKEITLLGGKREVALAKSNNELILTDHEITDEMDYQNELMSVSNNMLNDDRAATSTIIANKEKIVTDDDAIKILSAQTIYGAQDTVESWKAAEHARGTQEMAAIDKNTKMTAALVHLIG